MKLEKSNCESNMIPDDLLVKNLGGGVYEIVNNENVQVFEKSNEGVVEQFYKSDKTILTTTIKNKGDAIVALIRLKYSQDDEYSLLNKGIANSENVEYLEYRDYVALCKEQVAVYFTF